MVCSKNAKQTTPVPRAFWVGLAASMGSLVYWSLSALVVNAVRAYRNRRRLRNQNRVALVSRERRSLVGRKPQ